MSHALAQANHRLFGILRADGATLGPRGRVDVMDAQGSTVARIHCADALTAMS